MAKNEYRPHKNQKRRGFRELAGFLDTRSWLHYDQFVSRLPFLLFCGALAIVYIWNHHTVERQVRELSKLEQELNEMQWYYDAAKYELARKSRQSSVASLVSEQGIHELTRPPRLIEEKDRNDRRKTVHSHGD